MDTIQTPAPTLADLRAAWELAEQCYGEALEWAYGLDTPAADYAAALDMLHAATVRRDTAHAVYLRAINQLHHSPIVSVVSPISNTEVAEVGR